MNSNRRPHRRPHHRLAASAATLLALSLAVPLASAGTAFAGAAPAVTAFAASGAQVSVSAPLHLPQPTGRFAVGRKDLHLVDTSRADPWVPAVGKRELMVSMYYPARKGSGGVPSPYLAQDEARLLLEGIRRAGVIEAEKLASTGTNSRADARPLDGRYPLVVLSPGFTLHRATLTVLAEELTSRGYVVALLDHAHESFGTAFPGGRTLTCALCGPDDSMAGVPRVRAADASFVLDQLLKPRSEFAKLIDRRRIGMAGHSIGGNTAAVAMAGDRRIKAGVNLDGGFQDPQPGDPAPGAGLKGRPFLLLGTDSGHRPELGKGKWLEAWGRMDGWKRWLTVAGSGHFSFNDIPVLAGQLGLVDPSVPLSGKRSGEITGGYVGAFFDQHLLGKRSPLFDGPTAANPEVSFHRP